MALRCAKTNSLLKTINIFTNIKFILRNLGDYVLGQVAIFIMLFIFSLLASVVGGITFFIVGLGGWFVLSLGRFWGRMMWAYYLAKMELKREAM
jgi:NhaP-type Na+/H+ or K+/H+ antiporter